jgi:mannose-6-phosphate isomerase
MSELYPLKFEPILKEKIWGGHALVNEFGKPGDGTSKIGESWEVSAVADNLSVISNGFLAGNNIEEIIEVYMGDITGDFVFDKFGHEFPLLIKFIEATDDLSIQVHPGNELARERHGAYGKTEMWYVLQSEKDSRIYTGFSKPVTREQYTNALSNNTIADLLNSEHPEAGDVFFTPAGRVHAIGAGNVIIEIQQTSDITYRIYDWGRKGKDGKPRELHIGLALDAIDFTASGKNGKHISASLNETENLAKCDFFTSNILRFDKTIERDYYHLDSFVICICTEGRFSLHWDKSSETVSKGETLLIPSSLNNVIFKPDPGATMLEIYIEQPDTH